jgi:hypothetical protein
MGEGAGAAQFNAECGQVREEVLGAAIWLPIGRSPSRDRRRRERADQGSPSSAGGGRAGFPEQPDDLRLVAFDGQGERRYLVLDREIDVRAAINEKFDHAESVVPDRQAQGGDALCGTGIGVGAAFEERRREHQVVGPHRFEQSPRAGCDPALRSWLQIYKAQNHERRNNDDFECQRSMQGSRLF